MSSKKDLIIGIIAVVFFGLLIFELPNIEKIISGRKDYEYNESEDPKKQIDKYVCTFGTKSNVMSKILEATFYIDKDNVTRIYTKESRSYTKKIDFEGAVAALKEDVKTDTLETKTTLDNLNYTIIEVRGEDITPTTKTNYPTTYKELTKYLETNKYTCTIRYKK